MESKLKDCPFCGFEARVYETGVGFQVLCRNCGAQSREAQLPDWSKRTISEEVAIARTVAIKAWNRRNPYHKTVYKKSKKEVCK